ncbi:MAG: hypothetical protein JW761_08990, partial [Prolixibacteraceae bacterium]|nr:hypothetical protein [Prolixibacteraceae bacterium]
VIVLTIMKNKKERNLLGIFRKVSKIEIQGIATANTVLQENDIMVLYGHNDNIQNLLKNDSNRD